MSKEKKIVILGPTAVGKSSFAIKLALKINAEIISADSMQVYKHMDIGTAKPSVAERKQVKHYLIGHIALDQSYNVCEYIKDANQAMKEIEDKGKKVIITGGTGMYLKGLIQGVLQDNKEDSLIRKKLEKILKQEGIAPLLQELKQVDPDKYNVLEHNDHRRIIRALEYYRINKIPISKMQTEWDNNTNEDFLLIGLQMDRKILYSRIEDRVDQMIDEGLVEEVRNILSIKFDNDASCWQGIGYKELRSFLNNEISMEEAVRLIKRNSRRYAKRQLTWFRKVDMIKWFDAKDSEQTLMKTLRYLQLNQ